MKTHLFVVFAVLKSTSRVTLFVLVLLLIEFLDEFIYGAREAAWPLIRTDLGLTYAQIGLLLGLPGFVSSVIEPLFGILGDFWKRRVIVLGGGVIFAASLLLMGTSHNFMWLLLAFVLFSPASGAFVGLSQATLMDVEPARHEYNMARWTFAGSVGVVAGPLALSAVIALGLGWRGLFVGFAGLAVVLLILAWRSPYSNGNGKAPEHTDIKDSFNEIWQTLRQGAALRWLTLLQFSDLMLDVLLGYLALYMVDVVDVTPSQAGTAVAVWTGVGLLGDLLLIPLLKRVPGLRYLQLSAVLELLLFPTFLLVPSFVLKLMALALLGLFNAGWYSILKAQLYSSLPGRSGTVMAMDNIFGLVGALIPWGLGLVAQRFDLRVTMWLLLSGPVALLVGLPRRARTDSA